MGDYNIALMIRAPARISQTSATPRGCASHRSPARCVPARMAWTNPITYLRGGVDPAVAMKPLTADLTETLTGTFSSAIDQTPNRLNLEN